MIDWSKGILDLPTQGPKTATKTKKLPTVNPREPLCHLPPRPSIALINAVVYQHACMVPGAQSFQLTHLANINQAPHTEPTIPVDPGLNEIPTEYHQFRDIFDKQHSRLLPGHWPYDLTIRMEKGSVPPLGVMETLDSTELFMEDQTWLDYLWDFETRGINLDLPSDTD